MNWMLLSFGIMWMFGTLFGASMEGVSGIAATSLSGGLSSTAASATVTSTRDFPTAGWINIDQELIAYTGKTSTTFTGLTRGSRDTEAAQHTSGGRVFTEVSGLVNLGLDFRVVESKIPLVGETATLVMGGATFFKFLAKVIIWDWPYWDADFLGMPLYLIQIIFSIASISFVLKILYDIKQLINPFS